jgi:hypothetical protein
MSKSFEVGRWGSERITAKMINAEAKLKAPSANKEWRSGPESQTHFTKLARQLRVRRCKGGPPAVHWPLTGERQRISLPEGVALLL